MKFFSTLAFASLASAGLVAKSMQSRTAGEVHMNQARQQTVFGAIIAALGELRTVAVTNFDAIELAASETQESVDAAVLVQVQTAISANAERIAAAIGQAGTTIAAATAGAGTSVLQIGEQQLTDSLAQITAALDDIEQAARGLRATLEVSVVGVNTAVRNLALAELRAVENVLRPFTTPVRQFVADVQKARVEASGGVLGVGNLVTALTGILDRLVRSLGL